MIERSLIAAELAGDPLVSVDVGSRKGLQDFWRPFLPWMTVDAFEPDEAECEKQQKKSPSNVRFIPVGLARESGKRTLYVLNKPTGSSLFPPGEALSRYTPSSYAGLNKAIEVDCLGFSDYLRQYDGKAPNLIKLDTQGAELDILKSIDPEHWSELYAVQCEVEFQELYQGQPLFNDIHAFMTEQGFYLADLHTHRSYRCHQDTRNYYLKNELGFGVGTSKISAELIAGEALYFRKPDDDYLYANRGRFMKFLLVCIIYKYFDLMFHMIDQAQARGLMPAAEADRLRRETREQAPKPSGLEKSQSENIRKWLGKQFGHYVDLYDAFWLRRRWPDQ